MSNNTGVIQSAGPRRMVQLDFIRGIAILLVLFHHSAVREAALGWLDPVLQPVIDFGWAGVTLFFVLSGFLIGGLLFKEIRDTGRVDVMRFLVRRAFKIWPSYFAFIAYCFLKILYRKQGLHEAFLKLWPNLLHIQNYFETPPGHTWSLAVEEHFYLGFAIFIFFLTRGGAASRRLRLIPLTALGLLVVCLGLRLMNWNRPFNLYSHVWGTQLCADSLFLGVCLAYVYHFKPEFFERWASNRFALLAFAVAANLPMFFMPRSAPFVFTFGDTLMSLGFASLVAAVAPLPSGKAQSARFWSNPLVSMVAWTGVYSYSIYLWHGDLVSLPLFCRFPSIWKHGPVTLQAVIFLVIYFAGSVLLGAILTKLIEFPALRLRDRVMPAAGRREISGKPASVAVAGRHRESPCKPVPSLARILGGIFPMLAPNRGDELAEPATIPGK